MIDLYVDEVSLQEIRIEKNEQELLFANAKDESIHIPVSHNELLNILNLIRMRCEQLDLIYPVNIKRQEVAK